MFPRIMILLVILANIVILTACNSPATPVQPTSTAPPTQTLVLPTETPDPPTSTPKIPANTTEPTLTPIPLKDVPRIEEFADIGDYELHYECRGEGDLTIFIEPDLGQSIREWHRFMQVFPYNMEVSVCTYDRAGKGGSWNVPEPTSPRTSLDMAEDLHKLLVNAPIPGPRILVGHAMGAINTRIYQNLYPDEVAGMVLIDGGHPDEVERRLALIQQAAANDNIAITNFKKSFDFIDPKKNEEYWDVVASYEQLRAIEPMGDLPLVVLSHDTINRGDLLNRMKELYGEDFPEEFYNLLEDDWVLQMNELVDLSTNGFLYIAENSSLSLDKFNEAVIEAIRMVVEKVRE